MQEKIRAYALARGASLVGFAPANAMADAPEGFRPTDIMPSAQGFVVLAKALPRGVVNADNAVVYTCHHTHLIPQLDTLAYETSLYIEELGGRATPIPADDPYFHWEDERKHGMGILSHRHAAARAGLGAIGRNALLITPEYGNRVELVTILTDIPFPPAKATEELCPPACRRCVDACPSGAQTGSYFIEQKPCRLHVATKSARGHHLYRCWQCRSACPVGV